MQKKLASTHAVDKLAQLQEYPVRFMQKENYAALLGQQINQIVSHNGDTGVALQQIARVLGEAFQVDCCLIVPTNAEAKTSQFVQWCAEKDLVMPSQQATLFQEYLTASCLRHGYESLAISNVQAEEIIAADSFSKDYKQQEDVAQAYLQYLPVKAILGIPTWFQGKINGVVVLIQFQPYEWSDLEDTQIKAIATPVALAISQLLQQETIAALRQQKYAWTQYQSLFNQLAIASRSSMELNQILQLAVTGSSSALQVTRGLVLLLKYSDPLFRSREKREIIPKAKATVVGEWSMGNDSGSPDNGNTSLINQSFWLSECSLCQQAFTNSPQPLAIADPQALKGMEEAADIASIFDFTLLPAALILPLENQGTVLGFIVLQHSSPRHWHSEELALLSMVGAQTSNTIIQNQTLRQVQFLVDERTLQLKRTSEVQAKLYETTRRQVDQLRQLNQLKDEFVSTMSHELRTPLTSMSLAIRMLRQLGLPTERHLKYLDILEQQCTQEINLITDLLKLQQLESNQAALNLETIDLKTKLSDLAKSFEEKWVHKGLTLTLELPKASLLLRTDGESLERILQELLTNAGKYSNPDTRIILKVTQQINQQDHQIVLSLTNFGRGISPEETSHVFDKFRRGDGVTQQAIQGTGLGLALVKHLVQHLNGNIEVSSSQADTSDITVVSSQTGDSAAPYATCFTLTLPQTLTTC